jgi:chromosome partitioning protein
MLADMDRQQSSRQWLSLRPPTLPAIGQWDMKDGGALHLPAGATHIVVDTPAGLHGKRLQSLLQIATHLIVPLQPSLFDIQATHSFLTELREDGALRHLHIGVVGNRVKEHTISRDRLEEFVATLPAPMVAELRDTQNYVHLAVQGLTLWDVTPSRVERDLVQWKPLLEWVFA